MRLVKRQIPRAWVIGAIDSDALQNTIAVETVRSAREVVADLPVLYAQLAVGVLEGIDSAIPDGTPAEDQRVGFLEAPDESTVSLHYESHMYMHFNDRDKTPAIHVVLSLYVNAKDNASDEQVYFAVVYWHPSYRWRMYNEHGSFELSDRDEVADPSTPKEV
ncbi:MAG TPA: hypothetical protein VM581_01140, partial [Magnetospirillaceae bacterium]|nr:hypothetical protein [Magnetospirillaceae bacterium]